MAEENILVYKKYFQLPEYLITEVISNYSLSPLNDQLHTNT